MTKLIALGCIAAVGLSIAGSSWALNPQPLPPKCVPGTHCGGGRTGAHQRTAAAVHGLRIHCKIVHHHRHCRR
jgi:hypothetical protein